MASRSQPLLRLATSAEGVAAGLYRFRDNLPGRANEITFVISELFAISSVLRQIDQAQNDRDYAPSFYRIREDIDLLIPSLERTIQDVRDMFARSGTRDSELVWDDLQHHMEREERLGLQHRLILYRNFLTSQKQVVAGRQGSQGLQDMRRRIRILQDAQEVQQLRPERPAILDSGTGFHLEDRQETADILSRSKHPSAAACLAASKASQNLKLSQ